MNSIWPIRFALVLAMVRMAAANSSGQEAPVDLGKGSVLEGGKFEARAIPGVGRPAPDPANRLADFSIKADQEEVRIGIVELDLRTHTVSIPATVNMVEGAVEYFLVQQTGKRHESIFATLAKAEDIHVACLLAGWNATEKAVPIDIRVLWETNGPPRSHDASELVAIAIGQPDARDGRHITNGPWLYTGSRIDAAGFVATREGSIIALISDPGALVGNPRPGRLNDALHAPNRALLPPKDHPVRILLSRAPPEHPPSQK